MEHDPFVDRDTQCQPETRIVGCLLGGAVGDALGLPYEGLSPRRQRRLLGRPTRHRFLFGRGMVSDDTEHSCLVAQSLIATGVDPELFPRDFARRLRWWLVLLPAGIGRATLLACLKLWCGASPAKSGVFSAGNGPAMRSAIFGAVCDDREMMVELVRASARVTHIDAKAEHGAIAVALATAYARRDGSVDGQEFVDEFAGIVGPGGDELVMLLRDTVRSVEEGKSTLEFAAACGLQSGVTGYTYHTVPVVIHAWLTYPRNYRAAVTTVIECGGDADTTAAIVGGIVATATGEAGIPREWLGAVCEWPRTMNWMRRLGGQLADAAATGRPATPLILNRAGLLARNLVFLVVVLFHGFRRLLPPY